MTLDSLIPTRSLRGSSNKSGRAMDLMWIALPPPRFGSPFVPKNPEFKGEPFCSNMMRATHFAINKINVETGKNYKLVKVEKVVVNFMFLLTFTVMEDDAAADASLETLRAMVKVPYSSKADLTLEEWMYKPPSPAIEESVGPDR